ncbi:MAG TPA: hypothetical protein VF960_12630 [Chloroflexota bacterium]
MTVFHRLNILASFVALVFLIVPHVARPQNDRRCAWPIEASPEGAGNILGPEYLARYWIMPYDAQDGTMTIKGTYPNARFFSFVAYNTNSGRNTTEAAGHVYDAVIAPDPGTINPFVKPGGSNGTYTVAVSRTGQNSGNNIRVDTDFAWVVLRLYVPTRDPSLLGQALAGSVPLPTILLTKNGATQELKPCSPVNKLADTVAFLQTVFPPGFDLIGDEGTPSSDRLWFAAPTVPPPPLMPNPDNKYIVMLPGNEYQPGRIIVIHGKAPGTPDTYDGAPIWEPARGSRTVDMRFWSVCHNNFAIPIPVVACTSDMTTELEGGYYTIVISNDLLRPDWLRPNITWLPWGDERYFKLLFFRNLLPDPNFQFAIQRVVEAKCTFEFNLPIIPPRKDVDAAGSCTQQIMGDYYPVAVWCDKSTFVAGGWRACINRH